VIDSIIVQQIMRQTNLPTAIIKSRASYLISPTRKDVSPEFEDLLAMKGLLQWTDSTYVKSVEIDQSLSQLMKKIKKYCAMNAPNSVAVFSQRLWTLRFYDLRKVESMITEFDIVVSCLPENSSKPNKVTRKDAL
jgi:hypothetical protein